MDKTILTYRQYNCLNYDNYVSRTIVSMEKYIMINKKNRYYKVSKQVKTDLSIKLGCSLFKLHVLALFSF